VQIPKEFNSTYMTLNLFLVEKTKQSKFGEPMIGIIEVNLEQEVLNEDDLAFDQQMYQSNKQNGFKNQVGENCK